MYSIRKWMFKPKKSDKSLLARLYYADENLNAVAAELDSFDGRKEPERCTLLINKLRHCQDKVLGFVEKIMDEAIAGRRAGRDFRVKFPDDVLQDNLAGQLWFGAECLSAGSSIMNREVESASMRPLAKSLTRHLDQLRTLLREHSIKNQSEYPDELKMSLQVFDKLFAEFELSYVSAMVPVKTMRDYDILQDVMVLFSETIQRALTRDLITQDMLDDYDPALMFTIPRLAIVCGLIIYPEGPLNPDMDPVNMCEMFRPFQTLLYKIRELLATLTPEEFHLLEKCLCSNDEPAHLSKSLQDKKLEDLSLQREPVNTQNVSQEFLDAFNPTPEPSSVISKKNQPESVEEKEETMYLSSESGSYKAQAVVKLEDQDDEVESSSGDSEVTYDSDSSLHGSSDTVSSHNTDDIDDDISAANIADKGAKQKTSGGSGVRMKKSMPHQESKDSGMPSEPDPLNFEPHIVESHRLRHSRSWPETLHRNNSNGSNSGGKNHAHSKSPSMNESIRRGMDHLGAAGGGPSLELIDSSHSDSEGDGGGLLNRSAQEFTFNIPRNTSLDHSADDHPDALVPSISIQQGYDEYSNSGSSMAGSSNTSPSHLAGHMAYVTDALNSTFLTDPQEALEVTFLAGTSGVTSAEESEEKPKETLSCTKCQKRLLFPPPHHQSLLCDTPCDSEASVSTKSCGHTEPYNGGEPPRETQDSCVQATHSQSSELCLSCQEQIVAGGTGVLVVEDSSEITSSDLSSALGEGLPSDQSGYQAYLDRKGNKKNDTMRLASEGTRFQDDGEPGTSSMLPGQESRRSSRKPCPCRSGSSRQKKSHLDVPRSSKVHYRRMKSTESSRSRHADKDSVSSGDSASHTSDLPEESEITLAIQAAEVAARKEARARFKSSGELIHRLFVCISGVADQLQTNYAADLRHILKCVFECNSSEVVPVTETADKSSLVETFVNISPPDSPNDSFSSQQEQENVIENEGNVDSRQEICAGAPMWVPDEEAAGCTACKATFTFVRRRHHCRNCGNIFCGRCSSNSVPLPHYGHDKPVRVCNRCFVFHVTPFTSVDE